MPMIRESSCSDAARLAAPPDDLPDERAHRDAPDGGRPLEGEGDAGAGPLVGGQRGDVGAAKEYPAAGHPVAGHPHDRHQQRGLAAAVGAEQHVHLAGQHRQGHPCEHRALPDADRQIAHLENGMVHGTPLP